MRYHHRFDSNVWVWDAYGKVMTGMPTRFDVDTSNTATPWIVVYRDKRGGVSAATWVIDTDLNNPPDKIYASMNTYAFYNTRIIDNYEAVLDGDWSLQEIMKPITGMPFSPRHADLPELWTELTEGVSPSYESYEDIQAYHYLTPNENNTLSPADITLLYRATHFIPNSINKLHIGG